MRTKTVKRASRQIIEKYYNRLTLDFHTNKRVAEEVAVIQSKRLRNKIAGFTTVSISLVPTLWEVSRLKVESALSHCAWLIPCRELLFAIAGTA